MRHWSPGLLQASPTRCMHSVIQLGGKRLKSRVSGNVRDQYTPSTTSGPAFDDNLSASYFYLVLLNTINRPCQCMQYHLFHPGLHIQSHRMKKPRRRTKLTDMIELILRTRVYEALTAPSHSEPDMRKGCDRCTREYENGGDGRSVVFLKSCVARFQSPPFLPLTCGQG